jgi:hypothetical protein
MIPPFFDFDEMFARWLLAYAGQRPIFDLGCRTGHLVRALRAVGCERVWGLDKFPQFEPDIEAFCTKMDVTEWNQLTRGAGKLLIIARPDHGGWTEKVLDHAVSEVLYIGLERNVECDLGAHFVKAEKIEAPGMKPNFDGAPTFVWRNRPLAECGFEPMKFWLVGGEWRQRHTVLGPRGKDCDEGGYWVNGMGSGWAARSTDVVEGVQVVHDYRELDATRTHAYELLEAGVRCERWPTGWIRPDGKFYSCGYMEHDKLAFYFLGYEVRELEAMGWARVVLVNDKLYMHGLGFDYEISETEAQIETFTRLEARADAP